MKRLLLASGGLLALSIVAAATVVAEPAKRSQNRPGRVTLASRTALCKADCLPQNMHGLYKTYHNTDPTLMSVAGRREYNECVRVCLAPLPWFYVQRPLLEAGGVWFGQTAQDCLSCHVPGPNLRVPKR